jgi:hypothetical protein
MIPTRFASFALAALVAAAAAPAVADSVDLQLRGKDKVAGTLRPVFDTECYVCDLPRGALLSVALKGAGKPFPTVGLALRLEGVDVGGAPIVSSSKGATIKSYEVEASGRYTVCVVATGAVDGDYSASVSWKPRSSWVGTGGPLEPESADSFSFAAPAGAMATIDVLPAAGSSFDGRITDITGPDGFPPMGAGGTHAVIPDCPVTGDYTVKFANDGVAAGAWVVRVKLKLPKVGKTKVDLRDRALAGAFGDHTVFGRILGEEGGLVEVGDGSGGALAGASVSVPADALGAPTVITISATTTVYPEGGSSPAGPAVEFGPEGTEFAENATLTLPYDPAYFPGGVETLEVYVRDENGVVTLVPGPYSIDEVNHLVSFPVSHFSAYQAAASGPRPFVGDYYVVELAHEVDDQFEAKFGFGLHRIFANGPRVDVSLSTARLAWFDYGVEGSDAVIETFGEFQQLDAASPNDATLILSDPQKPGEGATFVRGASDDVLVGNRQTLLAMRAATGLPTISNIAGRWHVFHLGAGGSREDVGGTSFGRITLFGETGEITLKPDGTAVPSNFNQVEATTLFPAGTWQFSQGEGPPDGITWGIGDGTVFIAPPEGMGNAFSLYAALAGDVLVGQPFSSDQTGSGNTELFLLVRASSRATLAALAGVYSVAGQEILTEDRATPPGQGMTFNDYTITSVVTGAGNTSISGVLGITGHDGTGTPVFTDDFTVDEGTGRLVLEADGGFSLPRGVRGAVTPSGVLSIHADFAERGFSMFFGTPALPGITK